MNDSLATGRNAAGDAERSAREHLRIVAAGDEDAVAANVTPDFFNHRSADEPMGCRQQGPEGLKATIRWLHRAFADMRFEFHDVAINGDLVALHVTLHARQRGPFVVHDSPDARVTDVFPSNGRSFAARQTHWITVRDGAVAVHGAVRDDLGMGKTTRMAAAQAYLHRSHAICADDGTPASVAQIQPVCRRPPQD